LKKPDKIKTIVLGIGNILLGDEGIGVHIVKKLQKEDIPSGVLIIDGSTAGFRLFPLFETYRDCKFIIIDAIRIPDDFHSNIGNTASDKKDEKKVTDKSDLYEIPLKDFYDIASSEYPGKGFISFHQTTLMDVLKLFYLTYRVKINGYFIGININGNDNKDNAFSLSMKLSNTVEKKIPGIIELVKKNIMSLTG
jgi:hydrogenase maturation protease